MTARTFALLMGIAFTAAGLLGFVPALVTPPPADAPAAMSMGHGYLLGIFPINALHNIVHLVIGLLGFAAWRGRLGAAHYCQGLAVFYGALAVMGFIPGLNTLFGLVPIHGADIVLHAATALAAAWFGFKAPIGSPNMERRARERRQAMRPVSRERRMAERRIAGAVPLPG